MIADSFPQAQKQVGHLFGALLMQFSHSLMQFEVKKGKLTKVLS